MTDRLLRLGDRELQLELLPAIGGRIHSLRAFGVEMLRVPADLAAHEREPFYWGSYPLVPWSNRIAAGRLVFRGSAHQLPLNFGDYAIHGEAYAAAWSILESDERVLLAFEGGGSPGGYPWPYRAEQSFSVDGARLVQELSIANLADEEIPVGLGAHPWFAAGGGLRVEVPAELVYPSRDCIPVGDPEPVTDRYDLRRLRDVPWGLDDLWTGLTATRLTLVRPAGGVRVTWSFSDDCDHLVLASFSEFGAVAIEPVTHASDGFNRLEHGQRGGVRALAPGETLAVRYELEFARA